MTLSKATGSIQSETNDLSWPDETLNLIFIELAKTGNLHMYFRT